MKDVLRVDIETYSDVDLMGCGVFRYVESPAFAVLLCSVKLNDGEIRTWDFGTDPNQDQVELSSLLTDPRITKTAWNAGFEIACLSKFLNIELDYRQWRCTMNQALFCGLPAKLSEAALALHFPPDKQKSASGRQLIRYFCMPCKPTRVNGGRARNLPFHDPEKWQLFVEYNRQDVVTEDAAAVAIDGFDFWREEHKFWSEVDSKILNQGVPVDLEFANAAIQLNEVYAERLRLRAIEITGVENPNSVAQLKGWLNGETGEIVNELNKATLPALLRDAPNEKVTEVIELRMEMAKSSIKKYSAMVRAACNDDRVRGLLQFYGASRTGRWAGRLVQVQNLVKNTLPDMDLARQLVRAQDLEGLEMLYGGVSSVLAQCIRTALAPKDNRVFVAGDWSAIEARVTAWLAWETWRLDVFRGHGRIYEMSASTMFNVPWAEFQDYIDRGKKHPLRAKGKVAELACAFQSGPDGMIRMGALEQGLTEAELPAIVKAWRAASPNIVSFWYALEAAAINCTQTGQKSFVNVGALEDKKRLTFTLEKAGDYTTLCVELPSGRRLSYWDPKLETRTIKPKNKEPFKKESLTYMGMDQVTGQWVRLSTYGGKLCENITQAVARDILADALRILVARGRVPVMHIHDEIVVEVIPEYVDAALQELEEIMAHPPSWAPKLPVSGEAEVMSYYRKGE